MTNDDKLLTIKLPTVLDPNTFGVIIGWQQIWMMGLTLAMVLLLSLFFNRTLVGKAIRAVSVNRHGARLMGINVPRMVVIAFGLSAAMGALAGAAIAPISSTYYNMGTMMGLKGFAAAIVGGLGNFTGSVIAGLLLGVLESLGAGYISSEYKDAFAFIILLVMLVISPNGLPTLLRRFRKAAAS
jgi:branched-chain amino acid transport system permease protein